MIRLAPVLGAVLAAVLAIVVISGPHASAEGGKCAAAGEGILNFQAAPTPVAVPLESFLEDGDAVRALSVDRGGLTVIRKFFRQAGLKNLRVYTDQRSKVRRALSVTGLPTTILINTEGKEVGRMVGAAEWDSPGITTLVRGCLGPERRSKITAPAVVAGDGRPW